MAPGSQKGRRDGPLGWERRPQALPVEGVPAAPALPCTIPRSFGQPLGPTPLPLPAPGHPRQELPACLVLTPDPLTPALALAGRRALLNLQRYLLSWGDLRPGELEK